MAVLTFKVDCGTADQATIDAAFAAAYGGQATADVIANFVKEVYDGAMVNSAVKTARDKATADAGKIVIKPGA